MIEFERKERTNILPLRWFGNGCESIAHFFLERYISAEYRDRNWILPVYGRISNLFYVPGFKWGTYYEATFDKGDLNKND
jgi:hypothetical protein